MTIYVDSASPGGAPGDGLAWATAWTSIASAPADAAAGEEVRISHTHSQAAFGVTTTIDFSTGIPANPVKLISCNKSDDTYLKGALLFNETGVYDLTLKGSLYVAGCNFTGTSVSTQLLIGEIQQQQEFYDCVFTSGSYLQTTVNSKNRYIGCTFAISNFVIGGENTLECINCSIPTTSASLAVQPANECNIRFAGCDFSSASCTKLVDAHETKNRVRMSIERSKLQGAVIIDAFTTGIDSRILFEGCLIGATQTLSVPALGMSWLESPEGRVKSDSARYATTPTGASDGETPHSWEMETTADTLEQFVWLESSPITRWVTAGASQDVTIYTAHYEDLTDDDFWVEIHSPNEIAAANTTAQSKFRSSRPGPRGATSSDASLVRSAGTVWAGADTGIDGDTGQQKIVFTISPVEAGPVTIRLFCAKNPMTTPVYVDPRIEV